jgi:predicted ArsR family transcriptional regulator
MSESLMPGEDRESRQQQILGLLAREGPMTIAQMAERLGLAKTSLRPQVERLRLQGWLHHERLRSGPGRPADVFSVSPQSRRHFARQSMDDFGRALLAEVAEAVPKQKLRSILASVGRRLVSLLRPMVGEGTPSDRLRRLSGLLSERGIQNEMERSGSATTLRVHTCPYAGLAGEHRDVCRMDRGMITELVGGEIRFHKCMLDGDSHCEFTVSSTRSSSKKRAGRRAKRAD